MKKKIRRYFTAILLVSLLALTAVSLLWINNRFRMSARESLDSYLQATMYMTPAPPQDTDIFLRELARSFSSDLRITVIDSAGHVVADTKVEPGEMDNHLEREEFAAALRTGYGESVRLSGSTGQRTLYVARTWNDGYLLRFAMPISETWSFARSVLPVLVVTLILLWTVTSAFVGRFSRSVVRPYEKMFAYLETAIQQEPGEVEPFEAEYEELEPVVIHFRELLERITGYIGQISQKTEEIQNIIGSMEEGLVMLDEGRNILLLNGQAGRLLDIPQDAWQKNITFLYRDDRLKQALTDAGEGRHQVLLDIESREGRTLRFYINPVQGGGGYVLLISDVTDLIRLERMRSDFTANVSHELKTPLTSISGFAELIHTGMVQDENLVRDYSGKILSESRRLVTLIDDVLRLSRLESGAIGESRPVKVGEVVSYVFQVLDGQAKDKEITLSQEGSLTVEAPRERIEELVINLVDNAIKYNRLGGCVDVKLFHNGFSVTDSGIGIPADQMERIFERFYRVDKGRSRKTGGTGLGLSIVKHSAEQLGGAIRAESGEAGSTFTVTFPPERICL